MAAHSLSGAVQGYRLRLQGLPWMAGRNSNHSRESGLWDNPHGHLSSMKVSDDDIGDNSREGPVFSIIPLQLDQSLSVRAGTSQQTRQSPPPAPAGPPALSLPLS